MEFGKIEDLRLLEGIDWKLPQDDPLNAPFLEKFKSNPTILHIGAPAWNHKEWVGRIYPPKTKAADYLHHYSKYFNTIELNTTHYRIPTPEQAIKWVEKVTSEFVFCPKIFKGISHDHKGLTDLTLMTAWADFLRALGSHCGPSFLQLPPYFDYSYKNLLFKFLQNWPEPFPLALEFRHPSWFQDGIILPALTRYLQSRNIGLVITDVAGRRDVLHASLSSSFALVRFIGNELHPSDYERARNWNQKFEEWEAAGLKNIFFFVHEPDDILVPDMTDFFKGLSFFSRHYPLKSPEQNLLLDQSHPVLKPISE